MQKLLTIRMASDLLHKHYNTVTRWITEGAFPHAVKVRGGWFIPENDVRRLLKLGQHRDAPFRVWPPPPASP